jgi:hypothetical protein
MRLEQQRRRFDAVRFLLGRAGGHHQQCGGGHDQ